MTYGEYKCEVEVKYKGVCSLVADSEEDAERYVRRQPDYCLFGTIAEEEPEIERIKVECWLEEPYE